MTDQIPIEQPECGAAPPYSGRRCTRPAGHDVAGGHGNADIAWLDQSGTPYASATRPWWMDEPQ